MVKKSLGMIEGGEGAIHTRRGGFAVRPTRAPGERYRLLIVEDDEDLAQIIEALARSMDIEPVSARDGDEALARFREFRPDLCLVDILLPRLNGFEVCRRIKGELGGQGVPVVMMSSVYRTLDQLEASLTTHKADDFVAKPFAMSQLQELLRYYLPPRVAEGSPVQAVAGASRVEAASPPAPVPTPPKPAELAVVGSSGSMPPVKVAEPSIRVMVVEDDPELNEVLTQAVRAMGFEVVQIYDGEDALRVYGVERPDVCLVDVLLPGVNGLELCRRIKQSPWGTSARVILMSALSKSSQDMARDRETYGADGFLAKPFSMQALRALLVENVRAVGGTVESASNPQVPVPGAVSGMEGELGEVSVGQLIARLYVLKATGVLHLRREGARKEIVVRAGLPIQARSNAISEALGSLLIQRGLVSTHAVSEAINQRRGSQTLGWTLVQNGVLKAEALQETLREQVRLRLVSAFGWQTGAYRFVSADVSEEGQAFEQNPFEIIREGLNQQVPLNELASRLQGLAQRSPHRTPHFDELRPRFPMSEREVRFLELIDGQRTLGDLLQHRVLEVTQALQLVWALHEALLITFNAPAARREQAAPAAAPAPAPMPAASPVDEGLVAEVERWWGRLDAANHYGFLDVQPTMTTENLTRVVQDRLARLKPELVARLPAGLRDKAQAVEARLRQIGPILGDATRRAQYDMSAAGTLAGTGGVTAEYRLSQGAVVHGAARVAIGRGDFALAVETLERALKLSPSDVGLMADLAWCRYRLGRLGLKESRAALEKALEVTPNRPTAMLYLARLEADAGEIARARELAQRCIKADPNRADARALLVELEATQVAPPLPASESGDDLRSMWDKLFGE